MVLVAPGMLFQVFEPEVFSCHWTVGVGSPVALAVNVAVAPESTVVLTGCVTTAGTALNCNCTWSRKIVSSTPLGLFDTNFSVWLPASASVNGFDRNATNEFVEAVVYVPRLISSI